MLLQAKRIKTLLLVLLLISSFGGRAQAPTANTEALLVMDMQDSILSFLPSARAQELTSQVAKAVAGARQKGVLVIYVRAGFRQGAPEISDNNKFLAAHREKYAMGNAAQALKLTPALAPLAKDIVVDKHRIGAFTGSDLEMLLRAHHIQRLILCGFATSGVVLTTVREAADKDFQLTVLSDGCADVDAEVHRVLTTKVFPSQAEVLPIAQWLATSPK
ncbi:cysteine hydrolase family protein [Hymenobacter perfusus]|uniref:Cysteine hydrolase n=1 Tax=Hymenobacter perfusus TaxID=1236770 RepID=A0A3R9MQZ4_9BACT|nr:isochorismatase family cysteine hydrolase [Hymenobacter perfusus]RSK46380.1 cysteine hydrolase [Hymenobacter perfusus]